MPPRKEELIEWTEECQIAFDKLKELCTLTPILAYADYKKEFQLHTDASELGLGGVHYQADDKGILRVIACASRSLSQTERNYPAHKLEFLALKWAVTDCFHEYLYGGKFDVYTDKKPLTHMSCISKTACFLVNCASLFPPVWMERGAKTARSCLVRQSSIIKLHPKHWTGPNLVCKASANQRPSRH